MYLKNYFVNVCEAYIYFMYFIHIMIIIHTVDKENGDNIANQINLKVRTDQISSDEEEESKSTKIYTNFVKSIPGTMLKGNSKQFKEWHVRGGIMDDKKMRKRDERGNSPFKLHSDYYNKPPHIMKYKALLSELSGYDEIHPKWKASKPTIYDDFKETRELCKQMNDLAGKQNKEKPGRKHDDLKVGKTGIIVKLPKLLILLK